MEEKILSDEKIVELYFMQSKVFKSICVGNLVFLCSVLVKGKTIVVGLYLFPMSFWIIITGLFPFCSLPIAPLKSA